MIKIKIKIKIKNYYPSKVNGIGVRPGRPGYLQGGTA
jgi:hypothetical protein